MFFFFKQKTAYEMRISDWSSDVCSSDLPTFGRVPVHGCMPLTPSLERIGPICRQIEDAAQVLAVINGPDPTSIGSVDFGFAYDAGIDLRTIDRKRTRLNSSH